MYFVEQVYPIGVSSSLLQAHSVPIKSNLDARIGPDGVTGNAGYVAVPFRVYRKGIP